MKKPVIFLILILLIPSALADWFYNSQNVVVNVDISSSIEIVPTTPSGFIESATVNMTFFPKQADNQELLKFTTIPQAEIKADTLKFNWKLPQGKIDFKVDADVKTTNAINHVKQKINFPIENIQEDVLIYTKPSKTIDSNDENIIRIASELVKGEDDLYAAVFKLASWTNSDVNYNLSTLSSSVTQKASDVLKSRQGVCSDISSLFIALSRAVGIPARFVSGIAYTNSDLFPEHWGAHGWAEVYFPDYGWIPFDPTYGEYGWIDPTHIKFKDSADSDEPSTYFNWLGKNADLKTGDLEIKANLIDKTGYYKVQLSLDAFALKKGINFGSYNLLEAEIENPNDFYYATELHLSKSKEVNVIGEDARSMLLSPKEKRKVFWVLKLEQNLDSKFSYTFPLIVSTLSNISSEASFTASVKERDVSFDEVNEVAKLYEEEKQKKYSGNVLLSCKPSKNEFYEYEDVKVYCSAKNTGNIFLENADVCFQNRCNKTSLGISQLKNFTFEINKSQTGYMEMPVALSNELVSKSYYINFTINDDPKILIEDLEFPQNTAYDKIFNVSFTIAKKSNSNPKNVAVIVAQNGVEKRWDIDELGVSRKFIVDFAGDQLKYGKNDYRIDIIYSDELKKPYNAEKEFSIDLTNATIFQRFKLSLNNIESLSLQIIIVMFSISAIAFIALTWWLFRREKI